MRSFWLLSLTIFSLHCQQPPAQDNKSALEKYPEFVQSLDKLRTNYHDLVDIKFAALKDYLIHKALEKSQLSAPQYERILDHENDARILAGLTTVKGLVSKMEDLEKQLAKTEHTLCCDIKNILEMDREHTLNQQIEDTEQEAFKTLMELCYLQTLRRYQNALAIYNAFSVTQ